MVKHREGVMAMTIRQCTIVYFDDRLYGALLEDDEYKQFGGQALVKAFKNHHVQLARAPNGRYRIVEDVNSSSYYFIDDVNIDEHLRERHGQVSTRWSLSPKQNETVRRELAGVRNVP
jgi:hypothetical protein